MDKVNICKGYKKELSCSIKGMLLLFIRFVVACCMRNDSVILILCRNEDKDEIKKSVQSFEKKFNSKFNYPYVFLNEKEFQADFIETMKTLTSSSVVFGKVDLKDWDPPNNINMKKAEKSWKKMAAHGVPYADKLSYHNMCRFFSTKFFTHPLLQKYKYYWRIEPGVQFRCFIDSDPFQQMADNGYVYGFTITIREFMQSIPSLGDTASKFIAKESDILPQNIKTSGFMFDNGKFNGCHFWSNFEIGDFDFFRGQLYLKYADFLEKSGGFYYERWGDAPVHSLAVALLLDRSKIHFFEEIGYTHTGMTHCPKDTSKCDCTAAESLDNLPNSCLSRYLNERAEDNNK